MNHVLSPELHFICSLVRPEPDHRGALAIAQQQLDWSSVAGLAAAHGVRPHLLHALSDSAWVDQAIELRPKLETFQRGHIVRILHFASELLNVASAFDKWGIPFATFKGLALAASLYGDISRREFNDIDIIVGETAVGTAESVLQSCGYHAVHGTSPEYRRAFLAYQRQYAFKKMDSLSAIDLHWDFTTKGVPFPLRASEIWTTLTSVPIGNRTIPTLGAEELATLLAGHGMKEGWRCLNWICDFATFCQQHPSLNWSALWERAGQRNCGRSILVGLTLASELMDVTVDTNLLDEAGGDPKVRLLVERAVQRLAHLTDAKIPNLDMSLVNLELCETWKDKLSALWVLASTRTTGDYEALPLALPLWRLYHLTRPFRLAGKFMSIRKDNLT